MWFHIYPFLATDVFSVLWSDPRQYNEKTTVIDSSFSTSLIQFISSFLSQRRFSVSVEGEMSTPKEMRTGMLQGSVLSPTL
jgi:hypothetical protein